jgi:chitinase
MLRLFIIILVSLITFVCNLESPQDSASGKYIVGYLFPRDNLINPHEIAADKLTHINYAFADIRNGEIAIGFKNDSLNFNILNQTKQQNPNLKILISIGGWTWSGQFSDASSTKESRRRFIESSIHFIQRHKLDGIDIDWEFPNLEGYGNVHRPEDKENFTLLLKEFRIALDNFGREEDKHYLLTIAAAAFDDYLANTELGKLQQYLDFMNVMAYDMYDSDYDSIAGHHTPLFTNPMDHKKFSSDEAIKKIVKAGVPIEKLVLGVAFYGKTWEVASGENHGLYQQGGPIKKQVNASFKNLKPYLENKNGFVRYWDSTSMAPYLFNEVEKIFITYDDEQSLKEKCKYIKKNNLKGAMFWQYYSDYENHLLGALYEELLKKEK